MKQFCDENMSIILFEQQPVRRIWHDGRWFYSVIDTIAILSESVNPRRYWSDMKRRLRDKEGFAEVYAKCVQFTLAAPDGAMRETDCADVETVLRIIKSIPSPKAARFREWRAGLGAEVLDDRSEDERRLDYRTHQIQAHDELHEEIHQRGVRRPQHHAEFERRGHQALYAGETPRETEARRGIPSGQGTQWMGSEEMADVIFRDAQSRAYIKRMDIQGKEPVIDAHEDVSRTVRKVIIEDLGGTPPEDLPKARKSLEQAAKDEERRRTKGMDLFPEIGAPDEPSDPKKNP